MITSLLVIAGRWLVFSLFCLAITAGFILACRDSNR